MDRPLTLEAGAEIVRKQLYALPKSKYYEAEYNVDLEVICNQVENSEVSADRKASVLALLDPEGQTIPGIDSCPGALGRIFKQMRANKEVPVTNDKVVLWIEARLKEEIINNMIIQSEVTKNDSERPYWHLCIQ